MGDGRVHYLNGLRGLLAINVFLHHFFYTFYPELVFGGGYEDFLAAKWTLGRLFAYTPLNLLANTGMSINFFFLLSGYVQSYQYFRKEELSFLQKSLIKRYFRLAVPTLAVVLLVFVFHKLHFIHENNFPSNSLSTNWIKTMMSDNLDFLQVIHYALVTCFNGAHDYYQVLWTMPAELTNSWMILILLLITHKLKNKIPLLILWILVETFLLKKFYGVAFSLGMLICLLHQRSPKFNLVFSRFYLKVFCLLVGVYFASYPNTGYEKSVPKSMYFLISFFEVYPHVVSYLFGNALLLVVILHSPKIKHILSKTVLLFFGNISFMFYLTHFLILFSFSPWLYQKLALSLTNTVNLWTTGLLSFLLTTFVSFLFYKWIDQPFIKLCNSSVKKIFGI